MKILILVYEQNQLEVGPQRSRSDLEHCTVGCSGDIMEFWSYNDENGKYIYNNDDDDCSTELLMNLY